MKTVFLSLMIVLLTAVGCAGFIQGPFSGKVIDAETKEPIEGVVVIVVWRKAIYGSPGGPSTYFHEAKETLTDKNGDFYIEKYHGVVLNPLARIRDHDVSILIYKPGYCVFPSHMYFSKLPNSPLKVGSDTLIKFFTKDRKGINLEEEVFVDKAVLSELLKREVIVVELPKVKTKEERLEALSDARPLGGVPNEKVPILLNLINSERRSLSLEPYPMKEKNEK